MITRKFVSVCLLLLLGLGLIGVFHPQTVRATITATNENFIIVNGSPTYVTVENDYYIANVNKVAIQHFYIKPDISTNIVSHTYGFEALGGHEESNYYNSTYIKSSTDWVSSSWESYDVSIVKQTSNYVIVKTETDYGGYSETTGKYYLEMYVTTYYTFYADQPYYLVTYFKMYQEDLFQPYNPQCCFLFDHEWLPETNTSWYTRTLNLTGGITNGTSSYNVFWTQAPTYQKFPWFFVFNSTAGNSYGIILLDAQPTCGEVQMGGLKVNGYSEFQIDHNWGGETSGQWDSVTYLAVANVTTDPTYIDQLATDLWLGITPEPISNVFLGVNSNDRTESNFYYGQVGRTLSGSFRAGPSATYGIYYPIYGTKNYWQFTNGSGTYNIYDPNNLTLSINYRNSNNASQSFWGYAYGFKYNYTAIVYNNSDTQQLIASLEATQYLNITDLHLRHYALGHTTRTTSVSYPNLVKYSTTTANRFNEEGWIIENVTDTRIDPSTGWSNFVELNGESDTVYPSGTQWNTTINIQYFRIHTWQSKSSFDFADYHQPEDEWIDYSWNVHYWLPMPLLNQEEDMRIMQTSGFNTTAIVHSEYSGDILTFVSVGAAGEQATTKVYCGVRGEPIAIYIANGTLTWSYNASTTILTLNVTHTHARVTLTACYTGPYYELTVTSLPMTGITFTINGTPQTTPYTEWLLEGSYTLEMPETHDGYVWSRWLEDEDTTRIKTVTMDTDITLTGVFAPDTTPPTTLDDYDGLWHDTDFPITLTATDDASGVDKTYYSINDGATKSVSIDGHPLITTEGANNKLEYWSVDNAGNEEAHHILTNIKLDKTKPTVSAGQDRTVDVGTSVTFDATASTDDLSGVASYEWDFGDGTTETGITCSHTYAEPDTYTVTLTVKDTAGNSNTDSIAITVTAPSEGLRLWILGVATGIAVIGIALGIFFLRRRRPTKG